MAKLKHIISTAAILLFFSILMGCAATTPITRPFNADTGLQLASQAKALIGTPYQYGGDNPGGFDCSGLIQYTHQKIGIRVPRTTRAQLKKIRRVKLSQLQPGDLIFFRLSGRKVSHVGIYSGNNQMIHAPSSGKRVSYASLDTKGYWRSRIIATGRLY